MSQDWEASTDVRIFNDWFALDNTEELPPRYHEGFIPDLDESWLSALIANEVLPDPVNSSLRQFNADVTSFDNDAGCKNGINLGTPTLSEPDDLRWPEINHSDCLSDLPNYGVSERVNMVATDEEEAKIELTNQSCPSPARKSLSNLSNKSHLARSGQQASAKRLNFDKPKFKRTKISNEVRIILDAHFNGSAYPTDGELALLSGKTGLPVSVIKRWFMNARSRKTMPEDSADANTNVSTEKDHARPERRLSPEAVTSRDSLQDLDRCSPTPTAASIERYLSQPTGKDSVPTAAIESALQDIHSPIMPPVDARSKSAVACFACRNRRVRCGGETPTCARCFKDGTICIFEDLPKCTYRDSSAERLIPLSRSRQQSPMRAFSIVGSDSSIGSHISVRSSRSHISVDSRGSRRGRKRWIQPPSPPDANRRRTILARPSPGTNENSLKTAQTSKVTAVRSTRLYFCTWPSCKKSFPNRSAWSRHEEAVHHCPYQWICSLDMNTIVRLPQCFGCGERDVLLSHIVGCHFRTCASKSEECRTFLREDQLSQHIKGVHIDKRDEKISIPKELLSAWKRDNPLLSQAVLTCGFCGLVSDTWVERQDHVFNHMDRNICKSSWWPERLPTLLSKLASTGPFTCPGCCSKFPDITVAILEHTFCVAWSCRNLSNWHALFNVEAKGRFRCIASCRLCRFTLVNLNSESLYKSGLLQEHADLHRLRTCYQDVFTNEDDFRHHLEAHHGAVSFDMTVWQRLQVLEKTNGSYVAHTSFAPLRSMLCPSEFLGYHCVSSDSVL